MQWFDALEEIYHSDYIDQDNIEYNISLLGEQLNTQLDLPMLELDGDASAFFKKHYRSNWQNQGPMLREQK